MESIQEQWLAWKASLTGNILPVSTGVTVVVKPLWVLTGRVQGLRVSSGGTVVTMEVTGAIVGSGVAGKMVGRTSTTGFGTEMDGVGHGAFSL